ncbi:DNA repair protein rad51c [Boothiomyces sp. JEL0866]|nr:DNA repair protein rad51c [Boothiomyces sp. JEL0866]
MTVPSRSVFTLGVDDDLLKEIEQQGFYTVKDLTERWSKKKPKLSAWNALQRDVLAISTGSSELDKILGGGIKLGNVIELVGLAGIGKTQLCMQLCANVQLSPINGKAFYIDTEGSFMASRFSQIASASIPDADLETIMTNVTIAKIFSMQELLASINLLQECLEYDESLKLIVIDSIAFHFRSFVSDLIERTRILNTIAGKLRQLATEYNVAIVITNQMTTKIMEDGRSRLVPSLGESWAHACTERLLLLWYQECRNAWLCKSSNCEENMVRYTIKQEGIRDDE